MEEVNVTEDRLTSIKSAVDLYSTELNKKTATRKNDAKVINRNIISQTVFGFL